MGSNLSSAAMVLSASLRLSKSLRTERMVKMNVRVEYEATPIRHIAVQCPNCGRWFDGREITEDRLSFDHDIRKAAVVCPVCDRIFGGFEHQDFGDVKITECGSSEEVYKGCLKRREVWE